MCLTLYKGRRSLKPHDDNGIRWKLMSINGLGKGSWLSAPYRNFKYAHGKWNRAKLKYYTEQPIEPKNAGFHVLLGRDYTSNPTNMVWVKVRVRGFLRSGTWLGNPCETWRQMRIISVHHARSMERVYKKDGYKLRRYFRLDTDTTE